ncbi:MAG TPA: hypothetical protein VFT74_15485 [Isosphaeraceae bacterium]|nr:hypothetical protein [Isosphaeraceae bacterium]
MTSRLLKTVFATGFTALVGVSSALANGHHRDYYATAYTPSVLAVPTSYVSTSYLVPSSYVDVLYPTIYSTPVLSPTVYAQPTAYVVTGRRTVGRPIYTRTSSVFYDLNPTIYRPTAYYLPTTTTYDVPLLSSTSLTYSDDCVVTTSAPVSSAPAASAPNRSQSQSAVPPSNLQSTPRSNRTAAPAGDAGYPEGPAAPAEDLFNTAPPAGASPVEPPLTPTPEKDNGGISAPPGAGLNSPPLGDEYRHTANKPVPTVFNPQTSNLAPGALRGEVVSRDSRTPLAGVTIVFTDLQRNYADKQVTTDASGHFEVLLPNADWSVAIAETDNQPNTQYGRITSTGGRFYDSFDRAISSLRLNH